jgi:Stage II sporulation protein E (SpoIIE)
MRAQAHRRYLFPVLVVASLAASQGIEVVVNHVLRPNAVEITWISDAVLAGGFTVVTWLWLRLRDAQIALTDLERQQIVTDTQLTIAARVQMSLLTAAPPSTDGFTWRAAVEPAGKIGGDYYDFLPLADGRMCVILADVSGKGVGAAVFLANVRAILRTLARDVERPARVLSSLSATLLADSPSGLYVTCILAIVSPSRRSMTYVNAGHPAGVLWSERRARGLRVGGPPAGLLADATFDDETLTLDEGDLVVFVSDGVTEALDGEDGVATIAAQIERAKERTPDAVCTHLLSAAKQGPGPRGVDAWMDDRAVVVFGPTRTAGELHRGD